MSYSLITRTRDDRPVYWGKKESDDPKSRDLTLWVAVGRPKSDASNYRRVPASDEITSYAMNSNEWHTWMQDRIKTLNSTQILNTWTPPK